MPLGKGISDNTLFDWNLNSNGDSSITIPEFILILVKWPTGISTLGTKLSFFGRASVSTKYLYVELTFFNTFSVFIN